MKLCIIGKYPPIEGGVSASTYWLARGLAERGYQIHMVTNASEVEQPYRMYLGKNDEDWYEPAFSSGGFVQISSSERLSMSRMKHIPCANPFVSKLAGLATQIIRQHKCELIFCYYYEPYALAGFLASVWTGLPFVVKHAGSDLERLMAVPDLAVAYKEMLRAADGVITIRNLTRRFIGMGIRKERIIPDVPFSLPTHIFSPNAFPLPVHDLVKEINDYRLQDSKYIFDDTIPTIGVYGKVGIAKGSYDLVHALAMLKKEGLQFNFLTMLQGDRMEQFQQTVHDCGLEDRTQMLPFLPHWRVPNFIRTCTAVCFLERDFPIAIHGPLIPREVLSCGTCLILSREIVEKQRYRDKMVNGKNILTVSDPRDHDELAAQLRAVIACPERAVEIGAQGYHLTSQIENFPTFIDGYVALFDRFNRNSLMSSHNEPEEPVACNLAERIERTASVTKSLLDGQFEHAVSRFAEGRDILQATDQTLAVDFCDFVGASLKDLLPVAKAKVDPIRDILKYQKMLILIFFDANSQHFPTCSPNAIGDETLIWNTVAQLKPLRGNQVWIEDFKYDVTPIFTEPDLGMGKESLEERISHLEKRKIIICFVQLPNLAYHELKISQATKDLLALCDGKRATASIIKQIAATYGLETKEEMEALTKDVLEAMKQLYSQHVITFIQ